MKLIYLLAFVFVCHIQNVFSQNILLVDNSAGAPTGDHVFSDLQEAIDAAIAGDIIHVKPSSINYGSVVITQDSISIFGIGYNPDKDNPLKSNLTTIDVNASHIRVSGLTFTTSIEVANNAESGTQTYSSVLIDHCQTPRIILGSTVDLVSNVIVRNCLMTGFTSTFIPSFFSCATCSQVILTNSIIVGYNGISTSGHGSVECLNGCIIKNNLFLGNGDEDQNAFEDVNNSTVINNIFFGRTPGVGNSGNITNTAFKNNIAVASANDAMIEAKEGNTISGTITGVDQASLFTDVNVVPAEQWDLSWEVELATSPLVSGGTDGTNVGPTGGSIPYSTTGTPLPYIQVFQAKDIIKQGDPLTIDVQATGR